MGGREYAFRVTPENNCSVLIVHDAGAKATTGALLAHVKQRLHPQVFERVARRRRRRRRRRARSEMRLPHIHASNTQHAPHTHTLSKGVGG